MKLIRFIILSCLLVYICNFPLKKKRLLFRHTTLYKDGPRTSKHSLHTHYTEMVTLLHSQTKPHTCSPAPQILHGILPLSKGCPPYPYLPTTSPITSWQSPTCPSMSSSSHTSSLARFSHISFPVHSLYCFCISVAFSCITLISAYLPDYIFSNWKAIIICDLFIPNYALPFVHNC